MRIGLFMTPQYRPDADLEKGCAELLEQARLARECGFGSILVGQHMVTGPQMRMFQAMPLMARLVPETEGMQIGPGVLLLSMLSPVMVAEEGATLDWMSGGNYVLAGGLGYRAEEFEAMGTRRSHRVGRLEEALEVVRRLWTEDRVTHHGRHFDLSDVGSSVRPKQQPHPPIWLGGDVEPAIRRAGRLADAWLGTPTSNLERLREQVGWFDDERRTAGHGGHAPCPILRECFVGTDPDHAARISRGPLEYKYRAYAQWGHHDLAGVDLEHDYDAFRADRFLIGDADQVHRDILRLGEAVGTDHLIVRAQWPGLDQREALGNIERVGSVIAKLAAR